MTALDLQRLLSIEHNGWLSLTDGSAGDFYDSLMADDALMILVNGQILNREQAVISMEQSPPWDKYYITEPQLIPLGEQSAALVYNASALRAGQDTFRAIMTSVYRVDGGRLQMALYQQTTITH